MTLSWPASPLVHLLHSQASQHFRIYFPRFAPRPMPTLPSSPPGLLSVIEEYLESFHTSPEGK